MATINVDK